MALAINRNSNGSWRRGGVIIEDENIWLAWHQAVIEGVGGIGGVVASGWRKYRRKRTIAGYVSMVIAYDETLP